jgi:hypothetical protein
MWCARSPPPVVRREPMQKIMPAFSSLNTSIIFIALFVSSWIFLEFLLVGVLAVALVPLFVGGSVLWWFTTRLTPIDPHRVIIPYLCTVIAFIAHVAEEYVAYIQGHHHILEGSPFTLTLELLLLFAATMAPILWLTSAIMFLKRWPVGYFSVSVFLFGMMFIEPTHYLAPFMQGGPPHYVGGLWTAFAPIGLGWYTFLRIRREIRETRAMSANHKGGSMDSARAIWLFVTILVVRGLTAGTILGLCMMIPMAARIGVRAQANYLSEMYRGADRASTALRRSRRQSRLRF